MIRVCERVASMQNVQIERERKRGALESASSNLTDFLSVDASARYIQSG